MGYGKENVVGAWALQKLKLLEDYLPAYQKACKKASDRIYIDAFAGRGTWRLKGTDKIIDGSPKIALRLLENFTQIHLIEYDKERVRELYKLKEESREPEKIYIHHGDANVVLPSILLTLNKRAPTFVFLDPSRDQLKWKTVELLSQWRTELYLLYPLHMAIIRMMARDHIHVDIARRLDEFFGSHDWHRLWEENTAAFRRRLPDKLLDFYEKRLQSLGYQFVDRSECFRGQEKQKLYYMFWVSKHPVGAKIMSHIKKRPSDEGIQIGFDLF